MKLHLVAKCLIEKETITNSDVTQLIGPRPFAPHKEYADYLSAGGPDKKSKSTETVTESTKDNDNSTGTVTNPTEPVLAPV